MPACQLPVDLRRARSAIAAAELADRPGDRYLGAHLAALQVAAVVLAWRGSRAVTASRSRPRNAWRMLADVAPEFAEWAAFFAATEAKREAVRAGATTIVSAREADDLVRDAQSFLGLVERSVAERLSATAPRGSRDTPMT